MVASSGWGGYVGNIVQVSTISTKPADCCDGASYKFSPISSNILNTAIIGETHLEPRRGVNILVVNTRLGAASCLIQKFG